MRKKINIQTDYSLFIVKNNNINSIKKFCIFYIFNLFLITNISIREHCKQIIHVSRRVRGLIFLI